MPKSPLAQLSFQERTRREILVRSDLIPPLPDVVVRVLSLLNSSETEPEQLEEHLHYDPVLVAKMLGMVNSPFYGISRQITSIKDAVMILGFRGLRSLVLASSTAKFLKQDYRCYGHDDDGLWKHSLAVATGAKTLAEVVGRHTGNKEELFVAGLLHDIGKMLMAPYLMEQQVQWDGGDEVVIDLEQAAVGLDHAVAGGLVAAKWQLSPLVQEVLSHHHSREGPEEMREAIAIVRLADDVAHALGVGYADGCAPSRSIDDSDTAALGLDEEAWQEARARMEAAIDTSLSQLDGLWS